MKKGMAEAVPLFCTLIPGWAFDPARRGAARRVLANYWKNPAHSLILDGCPALSRESEPGAPFHPND